MEMLTTDHSLCYGDGCARTMSAYDRRKFLHVYACDYIRPERRGSRIEIQGACSCPGISGLLLGLVPIVLMNFAYGYSLRMQLLAVIATVMALQIGYLLGLAIRLKVTPERPRVIEGTSVGVFGLIDDAKLAEALRDRARCPLTERFGVNRANGWAPEIDPPSEPHARTEGWGSAPAQHP